MYKVGDKVKILPKRKDGYRSCDYEGYFETHMVTDYGGKIATITKVNKDTYLDHDKFKVPCDGCLYRLDIDAGRWQWTSCMFVGAVDSNSELIPKFKVGDIVRVIHTDDPVVPTLDSMIKDFAGRNIKIEQVSIRGDKALYFAKDYWWSEESFEAITDDTHRAKFQVGDLVLIKNRIDSPNPYPTFSTLMKEKFGGTICKISSVEYSKEAEKYNSLCDGFIYELEESGHSWTSNMFVNKTPQSLEGLKAMQRAIASTSLPKSDCTPSVSEKESESLIKINLHKNRNITFNFKL